MFRFATHQVLGSRFEVLANKANNLAPITYNLTPVPEVHHG